MSTIRTSPASDYQVWEGIDYHPAVPDFLPEALVPLLKPGSRVLDVGCNTGAVIGFLMRHGMRCEGIDLNADAIHQAKSRHAADGHGWPRFHCGDFLLADLTPPFDAVLMIRFLTCVPDTGSWQACLARAKSLLADGGCLYLHDFVMDADIPVYGPRYAAGVQAGWREGNFAVTRPDGSLQFIAHHHPPVEIAAIRSALDEVLYTEHVSLSMNGNPCRMFEWIGRTPPKPASPSQS
jgi:SAM-dependent methyltransferase